MREGIDNIETMLENRIKLLFEELDKCEIGSEEYNAICIEIQELYRTRNEEMKIYAEKEKSYEANEREKERLEFDAEKEKSEKRRFFRGLIFDGCKTVVTIGSSCWLARRIMKFEEEGVLTSKSWNQCMPRLTFLK